MEDANYIVCGDSAIMLRKIPSDPIDLVVTSPPYDGLRDYDGYSFDFETIADHLIRVLKPGGVIVWVVSDGTVNGSETGTSFRQALYFKDHGLNINDTMIWKKESFSFPESVRYPQNFEYMFIFSKGKPKSFHPIKDRRNKWVGTKIHGTYRQKNGETIQRGERWTDNGGVKELGARFNVWEINTVKNNKHGHPAPFPLQLAIDHILSWSEVGDIVLDPFLGSGTTAEACIKTDRKYIGIEISEKYFQIAQDRIRQSNNFLYDFGGFHTDGD